MNYVTQKVLLSSMNHYGDRLPPEAVGQTLVAIPNLVRQSIDMVFSGEDRARTKGKRPGWLTAASNVALIGVSGGEESVLTFEAPTLGDAAPELFRQGEFPWTNRPDPGDTGFDLLGDALRDVAQGNAESERFDARLLSELWGTRKVFKRAYSDLTILNNRYGAHEHALLNSATLASAKQLHDKTPRPQAAMIVGKLDMIRDSTQTFALMMDDGQEVRCMMAEAEVATLTSLFRRRVAVSGRAVFRRPPVVFLCALEGRESRCVRHAAERPILRKGAQAERTTVRLAPRTHGAEPQAWRGRDHRQVARR